MKISILSLGGARRTIAAAIAALACVHGISSGTARADGIAPPPPSVSDGADVVVIPKRLFVHYQTYIYPSYISWLGWSNGYVNSLPTFMIYLSTIPLSPQERALYMHCYIMCNT
jgi:hypothetical protein